MAVYLYAICGAQAEPPTGTGLDGAPLRMLRSAGLAALVSDLRDSEPSPTEDALWEHESVIERLMSAHDLLPARFGTSLTGDAAVRDFLEGRSAELRRGLRRVTGALELGIRAGWPVAGTGDAEGRSAPRSGVAYLAARVDLQQRARALARRIDAALHPLCRESRIRVLGRPHMALSAAYLIDRRAVDRVRARVSELDEEMVDAELVCTGPWPPYSFTEGGESSR
jgi:Gas vesicle synthesis protein GvpL/GvpF